MVDKEAKAETTNTAPDSDMRHEVSTRLAMIIRYCEDAGRAYRHAARARGGAVSDRLLAYADERRSFASELATADGSGKGTTAGDEPHAGEGIAGHEDELLALASCLRAEGEAVKSYEAALGVRLSPAIEAVVRRQYGAVKEAYEALTRLRAEA